MNNTTKFNGRTLTITETLKVPQVMAETDGLTGQYGVETSRGRLGMLQTFATKFGEFRRVVWITGKIQMENER